jgi:hypothetical protein
MVWLVGLPVGKTKQAAWELLQEHTAQMTVNSKFDVPELRVGTLDSLMALRWTARLSAAPIGRHGHCRETDGQHAQSCSSIGHCFASIPKAKAQQ